MTENEFAVICKVDNHDTGPLTWDQAKKAYKEHGAQCTDLDNLWIYAKMPWGWEAVKFG